MVNILTKLKQKCKVDVGYHKLYNLNIRFIKIGVALI